MNVWEDKEVLFDVSSRQLQLRAGELQGTDPLNMISLVGVLLVTNLRVFWYASQLQRVNLSIGYSCIVSVSTRNVKSKLRGHTEALYILTRFKGSRYEFIFTYLIKDNPRMFSTVMNVHKAFESSKAYREVKLRASFIQNGQLKVLPLEEIYNKINSVWNVSSDQGNMGFFYVTNVRIVWNVASGEPYNVSIPYIQIVHNFNPASTWTVTDLDFFSRPQQLRCHRSRQEDRTSINVKSSKFGSVLVIQTNEQSGNLVLGFKIDPGERLTAAYKEILNLHKVHSANPIFGVEVVQDIKPLDMTDAEIPSETTEGLDISTQNSGDDSVAVCYLEYQRNGKREPIYSPELGLAIEKLADGVTLRSLWQLAAV